MKNRNVQIIVPLLALLAIVSTVLGYQMSTQGKSGELVTSVWAMETGPLEKGIGESVSFKVKVKNTGNVNATYIVVAKFKEHGTEEWETVGCEDLGLSPGQYSEVLILGSVNCIETMQGKYFDVKFVLYDAETETVLDQKEIPEAWIVTSTLVSGTIVSYWVE